ncbi:hypothetical protein D3C75_998600 [compost metagenome]
MFNHLGVGRLFILKGLTSSLYIHLVGARDPCYFDMRNAILHINIYGGNPSTKPILRFTIMVMTNLDGMNKTSLFHQMLCIFLRHHERKCTCCMCIESPIYCKTAYCMNGKWKV